MKYEIETRVYFNSEEEVYEKLPFLRDVLCHKYTWETSMIDIELFNEDKIFRYSKVLYQDKTLYYLGYKGCDIGKSCNIRLEIDEEITGGCTNSQVMEKLGIELEIKAPQHFLKAIEGLGFTSFMSFNGTSLIGKQNEISFQLLLCNDLRFPILLEIEKTADTKKGAYVIEKIVTDFIDKYNLNSRVVAEEPTTLLYTKLNRR